MEGLYPKALIFDAFGTTRGSFAGNILVDKLRRGELTAEIKRNPGVER